MSRQVPKIRGFKVMIDCISDDEFLTFDEAERFIRVAPPEWVVFVIVALETGPAPASCSR